MKKINNVARFVSIFLVVFSFALGAMNQQNNVRSSSFKLNNVMVACVAVTGLVGAFSHMAVNPEAPMAHVAISSAMLSAWGAAGGYLINVRTSQRPHQHPVPIDVSPLKRLNAAAIAG